MENVSIFKQNLFKNIHVNKYIKHKCINRSINIYTYKCIQMHIGMYLCVCIYIYSL